MPRVVIWEAEAIEEADGVGGGGIDEAEGGCVELPSSNNGAAPGVETLACVGGRCGANFSCQRLKTSTGARKSTVVRIREALTVSATSLQFPGYRT